LAYGQTGTGKSLTISGLENPYEDRGILPRMVSDLFRKVETETAKIHIKMCIKVSFVEFSRTNINDLLQPYPNMIHSLKEMTTARVKSADEALKIIFRGLQFSKLSIGTSVAFQGRVAKCTQSLHRTRRTLVTVFLLSTSPPKI
jgi:hypothetical protein